MKLARIFLTPNGEVWFDVPIRPDQDCQAVFQNLRGSGAIVTETFIIPAASVHHVQLIVLPDQPGTTPMVTVPESEGKPN